jgi:hypothetical protein
VQPWQSIRDFVKFFTSLPVDNRKHGGNVKNEAPNREIVRRTKKEIHRGTTVIRMLLLAILLLCMGTAAAQPDPKKIDDKKGDKKAEPEKLVTQIHDLKAIFSAPSRPADVPDADAVVRLLVEAIRIGDLKTEGDGPKIVILDGGKLEVRATEKTQGHVKDMIKALAHLGDIAIDIKADLVELDKDTFEKNVQALLKPAKGKTDSNAVLGFGGGAEGAAGAEKPLPVAEADKIVKLGKVIQSSQERFANGTESTVSARQMVFTYRPQPGAPTNIDKEGYRLVALLVISGDRRFVRARLMEQSAEVVGLKKRDFGAFTATSPDMAEYGRLATVEVENGGAILFKLNYAPKEKVWLVMLHPTIFVQAEENIGKKKDEKK